MVDGIINIERLMWAHAFFFVVVVSFFKTKPFGRIVIANEISLSFAKPYDYDIWSIENIKFETAIIEWFISEIYSHL